MLRSCLLVMMVGWAVMGHAAGGNNRRKLVPTPPASTARVQTGLPSAAMPLTRRGIVLARIEDHEVASHIATAMQGLGAATVVDVRAMTQGRLPPTLRDELRRADAVVVVHTSAGKTMEPFWEDALVDAVRGVSDERMINVLVGKNPTANLVWPIVADRGGQVSIKGSADLGSFQRYMAPMLSE